MIRYVLCFLIIGGAAMAKDGTVQAPKNNADTSEWEKFMNTEEGQDITRLFEEFTSGKKTFDEAADEYEQKWGGKQPPPPVSTAPNAPYIPVR